MKTILTIFALTLGFTGYAQAIEMPLIGLPVKAQVNTVVKKVQAARTKRLVAGMLGGGVPYLCTGTRYTCGLTGDYSDATPVTNADTGLRDIVSASSTYALDSTGNLYRRQKAVWATRPAGSNGELITKHAEYAATLNVRYLCNASVAATASTVSAGSASEGFGWCRLPSNYADYDWALVATNVVGFFGGETNQAVMPDLYTGWWKADGTAYVLAGQLTLAIQQPAVFQFPSAPIAASASGLMGFADGSITNVNAFTGCNVAGSTVSCTGPNGDIVNAASVTPAVDNMNGTPVGVLAIIGNETVVAGQPDGSRHAWLYSNGGTQGLAETWAKMTGNTFLNGRNTTVTVPGTGNIKRIYATGTVTLNTLVLQTTTGETWRLPLGANLDGTPWTKL